MSTDFFVQAPTNGILKTNDFGDRYLYNINRSSFDKISAHALFDAEFSRALLQEDTLNIIIGTDSGLLPKYIKHKGIPSGSRYIFIEPEHILEQLHKYQLLEELPPEIICTTQNDWEEQANKFKINEYSYINRVKSFNAICTQQAVLDEYPELSWQLTETLQILHFRYSTSIGYETFIVRQLENITENIFPVKLLANAFQGKTVIILAGGPSLISVFPWLQKNRHKLVVFSVSRISRQLIKAGIEPDFVFSVDPQDINFTVSREMFLFSNKTIFINSYHVLPSLLSQWQGQSLYLGPRLPWASVLNIENIDGTGPTVTNTALSIAHYFGFSKILLAGFDLCFTKEGITHAQGSDEQLAGPKYDSTLQVETYNGEFRPTGQDYYAALKTLEIQAEVITADNREIINLAPTAAKANYINHIACSEITLPDTQVKEITTVKQQIPQLTDDLLNKHYKSVIDELEKAAFQIQAIAKLAQKALAINKQMYNKEGTIENHKDKRELDSIEKQLNKKYRKHSNLVKKFGVRHFIKITSPHDTDVWDAEKAQKIGDIYYQAYKTGASTISTLINNAIIRTKARQEELKDNPDFNLLVNQWHKDQSTRRADFWSQKNPHSQYSEHISVTLKSLQNQFNQILINNNNEFKAQVPQQSILPILKSKIKLLFKYKKIDEIKNLKIGFINDNKHCDKVPYLLLIDGYIAELEHDIETALTHYNKIINLQHSPLLEEALVRIAALSLEQENQQNAFLAIDCLAQLSPIYLPFQAELARIRGDFILAIDSYNSYISFFPEDTLIKLKLTALYIELKVYEAAELMLEHILKGSPDLESAISLKNQLTKIKEIHQNTATVI